MHSPNSLPHRGCVLASKPNHPPTEASVRPRRAYSVPCALYLGGDLAFVRLLRRDDADRLVDFFDSHTPQTIHDRYGYAVTKLPRSRAIQLVSVDQRRNVALGVFEAAAGMPLIAVGRYCITDDPLTAEVAFVVREDRRRLGIATLLLRTLIAMARERGLRRLSAQVLQDNDAMLRIFRAAGAIAAPIPGAGAVAITIPIRERNDQG